MAKDVLFFTLIYLLTVFSVNERPPASAALFASSSFSDSLSTLCCCCFLYFWQRQYINALHPPHAPHICTYTQWLRGPAGEGYKIVRLLEMPLQMSMLCPKMSVIVG